MGHLSRLRVRHDNSGSNPSWFLDTITIREVQPNGREYYFPCGQWLICEADGKNLPLKELSASGASRHYGASARVNEYAPSNLPMSDNFLPAEPVYDYVRDSKPSIQGKKMQHAKA